MSIPESDPRYASTHASLTALYERLLSSGRSHRVSLRSAFLSPAFHLTLWELDYELGTQEHTSVTQSSPRAHRGGVGITTLMKSVATGLPPGWLTPQASACSRHGSHAPQDAHHVYIARG